MVASIRNDKALMDFNRDARDAKLRDKKLNKSIFHVSRNRNIINLNTEADISVSNPSAGVEAGDPTTALVTSHLGETTQFINLEWQRPVADRATAPSSPSDGDRILVIATASGDFSGKENYIAVYQADNTAWVFIAPVEGFVIYVEDENKIYVYTGSSWVTLSSLIDHTTITNIGSNTHAQIDTHLSDEPATAIATHASDVDAHHAKYLDSEAVDAIEAVGTSTSEEADDYLIIVVDGVAKRVLCSHIDEDVLTAIKSYVDNSVSTYGDSDAVDAVEAVGTATPVSTDTVVFSDDGDLKRVAFSAIDEDMLTAIKSYVDANSGGDPVASYPDLDTGAYGGSETHDTTAEGTGGFGLWINPDGTKLYVCATASNEVNEYDLSPPYSIASMSHSDDFSVNSQAPDARSMCFNRDGTKMYIGDQDDADVHQYSLTAWDLTTASYETKVLDTSSEVSDLRSIEISEDGTKFYAKTQAGTVYQYTLNTPYDLSTGSYASKSFNTGQDGNAIRWSSDGMRMYVSDLTNDQVEEFRATTAWDVSTLEATGAVLDVSGQVTTHTGMCINIDGRYVYVIDNSGDDMYRYDCQHYHKTPEE